ncbi:MAG: MFS transporter [Desulfobacteraceae bacterium]|nr:MFS transporter [Desulfobacteraceae bacterium]
MDTRSWRTTWVILLCGSIVVLLAIGLRISFGLFLKPMSSQFGWGREIFALSMAIQNLLWGIFQPFSGAVADRWGAGRVVAVGGVAYALGLYIMSVTTSPLELYLGAGLFIGLGLSSAGLGVVLGAVGRATRPEQRSRALGIVTAAGSVGQLLVVPMGQAFLTHFGWSRAFQLLGICTLVMVPLAAAFRGQSGRPNDIREQPLVEALREARGHRGFWFLTAGFFVCGFHVAFIAVHLPAYLTDRGLAPELGAWSLSLIGLFNIFGSILSGVLGGKFSKKYLLSCLYLLRAAVFFGFIIMPISPWSALAFSSLIGFLWLGTIPLTSGLVAQIFGPRYMTMLFGIVFFSHQVGSFIGVWLGGYLFDATGSYMAVWWLSVALGIMAATLHLPIDERTISRNNANK